MSFQRASRGRLSRLLAIAIAPACLVASSCGRTDVDALGGELFVEDAAFAGAAGAPVVPPPATGLPDAETPPLSGCQPSDEECNGVDDDCDRQIDEELAPVPCSGGGFRYCVAGHLSACPQRCEVCMPGSERVCLMSYCRFWGSQTCAADGRSFGVCHEEPAPPECRKIANDHEYSRELEQCCVDNGYCCLDEFDLDKDGNKAEMLGQCSSIACGD